jgi:GR25 family glycosyltransferase involved in LPS biosynthesis
MSRTRKGTRKKRQKLKSVYWINLDRSVERRNLMNEVFKDPLFDSMKTHRISAIDGKDPKFETYLKSLDNIKSDHTILVYACMLSHVKAIQAFEQSGEELAMIFEDDVSLEMKPYWKINLETCIQKAPKDWEIIQLFYFMDTKNLPTQLYTESTPEKNYTSALAYIINRKGAKRFLAELIPNNTIVFDKTIPHSADNYTYRKLKTYVYKYPFFIPTHNESTLHPTHLKMHKKETDRVIRLIQNI